MSASGSCKIACHVSGGFSVLSLPFCQTTVRIVPCGSGLSCRGCGCTCCMGDYLHSLFFSLGELAVLAEALVTSAPPPGLLPMVVLCFLLWRTAWEDAVCAICLSYR